MAVPVSPYRVKEKSGWAIADPPRVRRRVLICLAVLCFAFTGLLVRLWYLQVVRGEAYLMQAQNNRLENVPLSAPRGLILDSNNKIWRPRAPRIRSRLCRRLCLPRAATRLAAPKFCAPWASSFMCRQQEIEKQIDEAQRRGGRLYDPVRVGGPLDLKPSRWSKKTRQRLGPTGAVLVTNDIKRFYPAAPPVRTFSGYSGVVTAEDIEEIRERYGQRPGCRPLSYDDIVGKIGIEREYDRVLAGTRGSEQYEVDARGRPVRRRGEIKKSRARLWSHHRREVAARRRSRSRQSA
jgi:penicillin-binding protein 2